MFLHSFYLNLRSSTTCINFLFLGQFSLPFSVHFLCSFLHIFLSPFVSNQPILRLCSLVSFQSFCRVKFPSLYLLISVCLSLTAFYYPLRVLTLFLFHCIRFTYNTFVPFIPITFCLYFSIFYCFHFFFLFVRSFVRLFVVSFLSFYVCIIFARMTALLKYYCRPTKLYLLQCPFWFQVKAAFIVRAAFWKDLFLMLALFRTKYSSILL